MEKIWLKRYPEGWPAEIDPEAHPSLAHLLEAGFREFAERPAFANMGRVLSYRELDELSARLAGHLCEVAGLAKGERVALMMPNLLQYPIALFAVLRAGLVAVNVNPLYTARELAHQLEDSGARAIVVLSNFAATLQKAIGGTAVEHVIVTDVGDMLAPPRRWLVNFVVRHVKRMVPPYALDTCSFARALRAAPLARGAPEVGPHDIAFLQYTGGTTGVAKGAVLTHRNMVANIEQTAACLRPLMTPGENIIITALPLYHIFSLTANCLTFVKVGGQNVLITNPRDIPGLVRELSRWRYNFITGVNTLFNALLNDADFGRLDFSPLKGVVGGGMAVQRAVAERWQRVTGTVLLEGYGLTETCPVVCVNPTDLDSYSGSIGLPVPSTEVSIRDPEGREVVAGESGELWVRGPQVMRGYWQRPDETAQVLSDDGWLRTGDIATIDEQGFVRIVDRIKDMILVSGFNVFPNEIEDVIALHDGVLEVGCIGVADERTGEAVKAFVVRRPGSQVTAEELQQHCRGSLTGYKVPRFITFCDELPKSNVGKILRRELRNL